MTETVAELEPPKPRPHPQDPRSNVLKIGQYKEELYKIEDVPRTLLTSGALLPGIPPRQTQKNIGKYLVPLTAELNEIPPRPTIDELPDAVIYKMVDRDKAFWVDKPGANAYTLHDSFYKFGLITELATPTRQAVFPRSYQYDLDCVKYRRQHACDGLFQTGPDKKPLSPMCRDCSKKDSQALTAYELQYAKDNRNKRWRDYPELSAKLGLDELKLGMLTVGRPFRNEACQWYNKHYPQTKHNIWIRKFAK